MAKKQLNVTLPAELYRKYLECAESIGQSLPAWTRQALAAYYSNWESPVRRRERKGLDGVASEGMYCGLCDVPASACQEQKAHWSGGYWEDV